MTIKFWPLEKSWLTRYREFQKNISKTLSASEIAAYLEEMKKLQNMELIIKDKTAIIDVVGVLSNRRSLYSFLFNRGSSSYREIIEKLDAAEINSEVEKTRLQINSPGGQLDGLFDVLYRLKSFSKPIEAFVYARADSAAYGIASQADRITAASDVSEVGSVGVGVSFYVSSNIVDITSTDAPDKWPDVTKEEGVDVVRAELDEIHEKFAGIIAEGRASATGKAISLETVNANFGRGGTMLAEAGLAADMIDEIIPPPNRVSNAGFFNERNAATTISKVFASGPVSKKPDKASGENSKQNKEKNMDLATLKSEHSELYKTVFQSGVEAERSRVDGLLVMGKASGKTDFAHECIKNGKSVKDDVVFATFKSAELNKQSVDDREEENVDEVNEAEAGDKKEDEEKEIQGFLDRRKDRASA